MVRGIMAAQWNSEADSEALATTLTHEIATRLKETIDQLQSASLVVSGGSTPLPVFEKLSQEDLDWSAVTITLADERWVPYDSPDSNERFVREKLMVDKAADAKFVSLYREGATPEQALSVIDQAIANIAEPFSVVILGMGSDGHTASLFPETEGLDAAMALDSAHNVAVLRPSTVAQERISLTRAALLRSRYRYLHITGEQKKQVLEQAIAPNVSNPLPIAAFFEKHLPPISVYWSP